MSELKIDAIGKSCPMPVILVKRKLKTMTSGQTIELLADDIGAKKDIPALLKRTGDKLVEAREEGRTLIFIIKKS
ncbi:MAG: sulfurtransferase TusA family protein [Patescibacteria group bacterium]|nr:sulfurtransferase TusA family protein [Patescibacteria group bacterium]